MIDLFSMISERHSVEMGQQLDVCRPALFAVRAQYLYWFYKRAERDAEEITRINVPRLRSASEQSWINSNFGRQS